MIGRIVIINDISAPKGGATALALASAKTFRELGYPVTFLTGDDGHNDELTGRNVEIVGLGQQRLTATSPTRALVDGLFNRAANDMIASWIARNDQPDTVYHLHGWAQILSPAVFHALKPVLRRTILSAHDFFLACPNGSYSFLKSGQICPHTPMSIACITANCDRRNYAHKLWRVARQAIQRTLFDRKRSPRILAIHEHMRSFLMRAGIPSEAIETVPNPVHPFRTSRIPAEANREFLFIGRLEATKGPDLAAAAARRAGVVMRFIGDGVMRSTLEKMYPEMIFTGHVPQQAIGEFVGNARALVMPSRYPEPYGLVAAEALWSGLPVILSETAFLADEIVAGEAGFACDPRNACEMASAMHALARSDELTARTSYAAFHDMRSVGLSPDAWHQRLLDAYAHTLSGTAS